MLPEISAVDFSLFIKALKFASNKHSNQRRKDAQASPYINHPIEVVETLWEAGGIRDTTLLVGAILHDTLEDTETTPQELEGEFGREILSLVEEVTDDKALPKDVRKALQVERAPRKSARAKQLKLADLICNIRSLRENPPHDWARDRKEGYITWARQVFAGLKGSNPVLEEQCLREIEASASFVARQEDS
jgi:GTP diphosphokinase / guanosine-3',5'-bis(diphosphate) 3'-diphosphatase